MPVQILIQLAMKVLTAAAFDKAVVLALWARARATPGKLDDVLVQGVAAALGVALPEAPQAPAAASDGGSDGSERGIAVIKKDADGSVPAPGPGERVA